MLLNNFVSSLATPSNTMPLIDYKWSTNIDTLGNKYIFDYGKSHSNADLYFGRGAHFNGIDQSISLSNINLEDGSTFTFVASFEYTGNYSDYLISGKYNGFQIRPDDNGELYLSVSYTEQGLSTYLSGLFEAGKYYTITVTCSDSEVKVYINGMLVETFSVKGNIKYLREFVIGSRQDNTYYYEGTTNNFIFMQDILTATQIEYQYKYPEKFLYKEDGILKSQILTQDEIDNVVAYLPMCETDGYVRDMATYSETEIEKSFISIDNEDEIGTFSATDTSFNVEITTEGSASYRPRCRFSIPTTDGSNDMWVSFNVNVLSGELSMYQLYLLGGNNEQTTISITSSGFYKLKLNSIESGNVEFVIYVDGTKLVNVEITDIKLTAATGTYQIANYTNAVRDNAVNLRNGLQTCFWKRDSLGVSYAGSFDRLECDGNGYADTGWVPDANSDFQIEFNFINQHKAGLNVYKGIGIEENNNADIYIRQFCSGNGLSFRFGDSSLPNVDLNPNTHIIVEYTRSPQNVKVYKNGILMSSTNVVFDASVGTGRTFCLGGVQRAVVEKLNNNIQSIFKIHTTLQDPLELYNKAVAKGLLQ